MNTVRCSGRRFPMVVAGFALVVVATLRSTAQDVPLEKEAYLNPPKEIAEVVRAARENVTLSNLSPDGRKFLVVKSDGLPTLERMARPCVHLGELAFDPVAHRCACALRPQQRRLRHFLPRRQAQGARAGAGGARVSNPMWSPDGGRLAFFVHFADATHIYVADTATGRSRQLTQTPVLATLVSAIEWSRDGQRIQTVLVPAGNGAGLTRSLVATEPKVRVALEGKLPSRTFRYLLESPHDMKLLEHLITGQLACIDIADGMVTKIGPPSMIRSASMSPGGEQFRVVTVQKPFSYYVPAERFGSLETIWDKHGKALSTLAEKKLRMTEPQPAVVATAPAGKGFGKKGFGTRPVTPADPQAARKPIDPNAKRDLAWRPDGAGLSFVQAGVAKPAGDKKAADEKKGSHDRVVQWLPPFGKDSVKVVYEAPERIAAVQYSEDCRWLFVTQTVDGQRQIVAVDASNPKTTHVVYTSGKAGGRGGDAEMDSPFTPPAVDFPETGYDDEQVPQKKGRGRFGGFGGGAGFGGPALLTRAGRGETRVVRMSPRGEVYLAGTDRAGGAFAKPYIDRIDMRSGAKKRVFTGKGGVLETIDAVDGVDIHVVFTTRQKKDVVPDSYRTDLATGTDVKLTANVDHAPWFHALKVERIQVTRVDGFKFFVKVTTAPAAKGKLPAMFWIYPREYVDQAAYSRSAGAKGGKGAKGGATGGAGRFAAPAVRSMTLLTRLGYAVVEPDVPIVGPAGRINDNYVPDLRNSLWAVIDALDRRGIIDRDRLAVGGHSYGAFGTANALIHTPFFKAGIAGDGNYNRTLTPMSFQTEKRHLWEARETYLEMSPMLWADRMNGALLMYHGMEDANVGTHPANAEHLFASLRGLGKPAALYMYPYEGHGPLALETTLDQWARWTAWLERYVKQAGKQK